MKKITAVSMIVLLLGCVTACGSRNSMDEGKEAGEENKIQTEQLTGSLNTENKGEDAVTSYEKVKEFSYQLFEKNLNTKNPVLSPVSAYLALTMAGIGSDGDTLKEFQTVLGEDMAILAGSMMNQFPTDSDGLKLSIANSVWADSGFVPGESWMNMMENSLDADMYRTSLSSKEAVQDINQWVSNCTNGLIEKIADEPFDAQTKLVLLNTVYFNGRWKDPFMKNTTKEEDFTLSGGKTVTVDMMNKYAELCEYIEDETVQGVVLPYRSGTLEFVVVKTTDGTDIREFAAQFSEEQLTELLEGQETRRINLKLPRFEVTFEQKLNESLAKMGINRAFQSKLAEFSTMGTLNSELSLFISLVYQKAVVAVDEDGTEAAAVTEVLVGEGAALIEGEIKDVFFTEPFLYMIIDRETEVPVFMGIMEEPV